jgi:hypothetical protein
MNDFDFSQIDDNIDQIYECDEEDWMNAVFGDDNELIRQLVG